MEQFTLTKDVQFRIKRNAGYREEAAEFVKDYLRKTLCRSALDDTRTIFFYDERYRARFFYRQNWAGGAVIELVADTLDDGTVYNVRQVLLDDDEKKELHDTLNSGKCEVKFHGDFKKALWHLGTRDDMREFCERMDRQDAADRAWLASFGREEEERHARIDALHERIHAERIGAR